MTRYLMVAVFLMTAAAVSGCDELGIPEPELPEVGEPTPIDGIYRAYVIPLGGTDDEPQETLFDLIWTGTGFDMYRAGAELPWPDTVTGISLTEDNTFRWEDEDGECWVEGEAWPEEIILTGNCLARKDDGMPDVSVTAAVRPLTDPEAIDGYYDLAMSDIDYADTLMPKNWNGTVDISVNPDGLLDISAFGFFYAGDVPVTDSYGINWKGMAYLGTAGGYYLIPAAIRGTADPKAIELFVDLEEPDGFAPVSYWRHYRMTGNKRLASLTELTNDWRMEVAYEAGCPNEKEGVESETFWTYLSVTSLPDGRLLIGNDSRSDLVIPSVGDGEWGAASEGRLFNSRTVYYVRASPPELELMIEYIRRDSNGQTTCRDVLYSKSPAVPRYIF